MGTVWAQVLFFYWLSLLLHRTARIHPPYTLSSLVGSSSCLSQELTGILHPQRRGSIYRSQLDKWRAQLEALVVEQQFLPSLPDANGPCPNPDTTLTDFYGHQSGFQQNFNVYQPHRVEAMIRMMQAGKHEVHTLLGMH